MYTCRERETERWKHQHFPYLIKGVSHGNDASIEAPFSLYVYVYAIELLHHVLPTHTLSPPLPSLLPFPLPLPLPLPLSLPPVLSPPPSLFLPLFPSLSLFLQREPQPEGAVSLRKMVTFVT